MTRTKTILRALLGVGAAGAIAAFGTFSAFSSTTDNPGNTIATGTVAISDNDGGSTALIDLPGAKPGVDYERCIQVTYEGTLAADVRMYLPTAIGSNGDDIDVEVTPGTVPAATPFKSCTGFAADASGDLWGDGPGGADTLDDLQVAADDWDSGLQFNPGGSWVEDEIATYKFTVRVRDTAAQNTSTNAFPVKFEARNQ